MDRSRLIKKPEETQAPSELRTQSVAKKLCMHVVRIEPIEGSSRGVSERRRRSGTKNVEVQESSQWLKQVQLAIAEFFKENR
jgi:hypothetical protein